MAYEAILRDKEGKAISDVQAIFDRAWLLNGYEQCSFTISAKKELARLDDFTFGNYLTITDDELPIWGGYFDPNQPWSTTGKVGMNAYSGEKLFGTRAYKSEKLLKGSPGAIYRQIIEAMNSVIPWATLIRTGNIYDGGDSREETISTKALYDDVLRISARSGNDFYVEPVIQDGILNFDGHWYAKRGEVKDFALEEGVNVEAKDNVIEYQGEIWNYIFAFGNAATGSERETAIAYNQVSIDRYGPRMYPLSVDSNNKATVQASADVFLKYYANPRRTFNLTVGGKRVREDAKSTVFKTLRIGDTVDLNLYSPGYENGKSGVETKVRIFGMTHRGKRNTMELTANEVLL